MFADESHMGHIGGPDDKLHLGDLHCCQGPETCGDLSLYIARSQVLHAPLGLCQPTAARAGC